MPSATDRPAGHQPYVFVSYASADRERILPLVGAMERAGIAVWLDQQGIGGGENYGTVIAEAIKGSAAFVLMASAASLTSRNCKQEIALGWRFERPYLPLLLEEVTIPDDLAYWLEAAQWIEVREKGEGEWLPAVLAALAPLGIIPTPVEYEEIHLAGRERELALLREKLASAKGGTGGLALIGGEAGIGKTTLADASLREAASQGFAVLEGHCFNLAETPPYGPFIDLFLHLPDAPAMPPLPEAFAVRGTVGAVASQMALFAQVEDFLRALATSRPVVLLLDDLHWADPASLDLLRFLTRSVATLPLLVLVTYRSDELTRRHPLYALLPQLARDAGTERLDLRSLDDNAVHSLVTERYHLPDEAAARLATYLQTRAEGNALFVGELLRSLEEASALRLDGDEWRLGDLAGVAIPALLRQVIDGRLARLGDESQRLLAVAAVIGHEIPVAVWAAVGEVDENAVLALAEEGLEAHLLVEGASGENMRFAHALIRESLFESIPAIRRRRIHRRIGEALASGHTPDPDAVAFHFQQAGDARAAEWLVRAGERAQAAWAYDTAAARYDEALALLENDIHMATLRYGMLLRLTRLRRFSNSNATVAYAEEALRIAEEAGDAAMATAAQYRLGTSLCYAYRYGEGLPAMKMALAAFAALPAPAWERLASIDWMFATSHSPVATYAARLAEAGRFAEAETLANEVFAAFTSPGEAPPDAALALATTDQNLGRPEEAQRMWNLARAGSAAKGEFDNAVGSVYGEMSSVVLVYHADRPAERVILAEQARTFLQRATRLFAGTPPECLFPHVGFIEGRWEEIHRAASQYNSALRLLSFVPLASLARAEGDVQTAWRIVGDDAPSGPTTEPGATPFLAMTGTQRLAAALALDAGDLPTAKEWLDAHDRWLAWSGAIFGLSEGQALWAQYQRQFGDADQAYQHAQHALAHATTPRQPLALIAAHRLLGELDTEAGRNEGAAAHLDASLTLADACQAPYERALTLLAMAELRAATGENETARALLDAVKAICAPLGAKPALARAAALTDRLASG